MRFKVSLASRVLGAGAQVKGREICFHGSLLPPTALFPVFIVFPFPECPAVGTTQGTAFQTSSFLLLLCQLGPLLCLSLALQHHPISTCINLYSSVTCCKQLGDFQQWQLQMPTLCILMHRFLRKRAGKEKEVRQTRQSMTDPLPPPPPPTPRTEFCTLPMPVDLSRQDRCQRQQFGSPGRQSPWRLLLTY